MEAGVLENFKGDVEKALPEGSVFCGHGHTQTPKQRCWGWVGEGEFNSLVWWDTHFPRVSMVRTYLCWGYD